MTSFSEHFFSRALFVARVEKPSPSASALLRFMERNHVLVLAAVLDTSIEKLVK